MKQILHNLNQVLVPVKRKLLVSIFLLVFGSVFGQNAIVGSGFSTGWGGGSCPTGNTNFKYLASNAGTTYGVITTANGTGDQVFRFGVDWSGITAQLAITPGSDVNVVPNTTYSLNTACTPSGAMRYFVPSTSYNYVFKTLNAGTSPTGTFVFFEVQGAVRSVTAVEQSPLAANVILCSPTIVTATLDGALSPGQAVYIRYTKDSYTTSTVVAMTGSGTTYTATIPSAFNTATAGVSYYVFTSGTTTPSGTDADLYTINLNNNGGSNYSYTVGGATTAIPDPKFEQALIDLNLDCAIDGQVLTSNISGVTELNVIGKNIVSIVGIKDFASLTMLRCNNNVITDLDVSGMTQLKFLYCQNNSIANLNINGLTNLWELMINDNPLSTPTLDLHGSPDLYFLVCERNGLTDLNITGLTRLEQIYMMSNSIATLDVSNNPNLFYLDCDDNAFTNINVNGLTNLEYFYCSFNQLASINVSDSTKLIEFYCNDNLLTNIDVRGLTSLDYFDCTANTLPMCILVDNVIAANTATTTEVLPSTDPKSYFWAKDLDANYSYCSCNEPITWDGTAWSNGTGPTSETDAIIAGPYSQSAPISACSLTINNNAVVTIPSGTNVTLNAPIIVTSGSFTLENNANLIQTNKNSVNSGAITVNRNSNSLFRLDYTMWSSPVTSQNLLAFSPLTTLTPESRFYTYNSATNLYNTIVNPSATAFANGTGYLIRMPNTNPTSGYDAGTTSIVYPGVFTGVPNNGNVSLTSLTSDKYYAVGNPYASTISANAFINGNSTDGTLYFWRKKNAGAGTAYATYNLAGSTVTAAASGNGSEVPNGTIQVGQGFIVKTGLTATTLNFNNTMRTANNVNQIFKTRDIVERNRVWLNLTNTTGVFSQALVGYMTNATQGIDAGIDGKYINDSPIALTSNINNEEYTIQGRALPFDASDVVALNFKTDLAGDYTIAIDHVDGLFSGSQDVFLRDNTNGIETDLKAGAYTFTAAAGVDNARFSLKYQKTLGVSNPVFNDNSVTVYKNKGTLYVNSGAVAIANIKIFDIQGKLIAERNNVKANSVSINNLKATKQVLIVKITSQDNKVVSKKVVN